MYRVLLPVLQSALRARPRSKARRRALRRAAGPLPQSRRLRLRAASSQTQASAALETLARCVQTGCVLHANACCATAQGPAMLNTWSLWHTMVCMPSRCRQATALVQLAQAEANHLPPPDAWSMCLFTCVTPALHHCIAHVDSVMWLARLCRRTLATRQAITAVWSARADAGDNVARRPPTGVCPAHSQRVGGAATHTRLLD